MGTPWPPRGPDDLDEAKRARIRRDVLSGVRPGGPRLSDRAYGVMAVLAAPAPHLARAIVSLGLVLAVVAGATVASADALPDEPLYGVKVASEQMRLALARAPEDRAAVELSMADHRLAEAERLALSGREPDALVAASAYGTHLANAAAELAAVGVLEPTGRAVVDRLKARLAEQQVRAAEVATRLAADPVSAAVAPVFQTVASAPPTGGTATVAEQIADHAASVNDQLAAVAEQRAGQATQDAEAEQAPAQAAAPTVAAAGRVDEAPQPANAPAARRPPQPAKTAASTKKPESAVGNVAFPDASAKAEVETARRDLQAALQKAKRDFEAALEKVKRERGKAAEAAKKAKDAAKRTPSPKPAPKTAPKPAATPTR